MDIEAEANRERNTLVSADRDIAEGETRVARQQEMVSELRAKGYDAREAERLLTLLRWTLTEWRRHRDLTVQRIFYLETKLEAVRDVGRNSG